MTFDMVKFANGLLGSTAKVQTPQDSLDESFDRLSATALRIKAERDELLAFTEAVMRSGLLSGEYVPSDELLKLQRLGTDALNHAQGDDLP